MNTSDSNETPSFDLPQPNLETVTIGSDENPETSPSLMNAEAQSVQVELPQSSAVSASLAAQAAAVSSAIQPLPVDPALTVSPAVATDAGDLIEKEWVLRAKAIVARTKSDPHMQNEELNKFKADFMKKKYNKDIKVGEA